MEDKEKDIQRDQTDDDDKKDLVFKTEEISIEEMAIDGICGVY